MATVDTCYQDASRKRRYSEIESRKVWYCFSRTIRFARRQGFLTPIEAETKLVTFMLRIGGH